MEFKLRYYDEEKEEPKSCDCCYCNVPLAEFTVDGFYVETDGVGSRNFKVEPNGRKVLLCAVCSKTGISRVMNDPRNEPSPRELIRIIAQVTNIILDEIEENG